MSITTGRSAYDADGNLVVYAAGVVVPVEAGSAVTYGEWVELPPGDRLPGPGVYELADGVAGLSASNPVTYRSVTIAAARRLP